MIIENWQSAAVVVAVVVALVLVVFLLRKRLKSLRVRLWGVGVETADDTAAEDENLRVTRTSIVKSLVDTVRSAKVRFTDSRVRKSSIIVRSDDTSPRPPGPGAN
ncbi:hypothetical protein [Streptomyces lavendulocolor]|uniref:hypothetical protein n=1 Tax=Streptomyces lavendulocolor TaxID=67316 RepID=UPI0033EB1472